MESYRRIGLKNKQYGNPGPAVSFNNAHVV